MDEFRIIHTIDGVFFSNGDSSRRRKITNEQAIHLMAMIWKGEWRTEAITVIRRVDRKVEHEWHR